MLYGFALFLLPAPMRLRLHSSPARSHCALTVLWLFISLAAFSSSPKIDFIEPFLTHQVLIHFDTEANRTYALQYTESITNGVPGGSWTNLFVAPSIPFPNHYVVLDTRLRPQRFYRLQVTP